MDPNPTCTVCHIGVRSTDYFCFNCGVNLHPKPLSTTLEAQLILYIKCIVLVPFGVIWGARYLKQADDKSKIVGLIAIVITLVATILVTVWTVQSINRINTQVNQQIRMLQGF